MVKRRLAAWLVAGALSLPATALACPYCAKQDNGGVGKIVLLGAMILFPFAVTGVVFTVVRRASRIEDETR